MNINKMTQKQMIALHIVKETKDPILYNWFRDKDISKYINPGIYTKTNKNVIIINDDEKIRDLIGYIKKNNFELFSIIPKDYKALMSRSRKSKK